MTRITRQMSQQASRANRHISLTRPLPAPLPASHWPHTRRVTAVDVSRPPIGLPSPQAPLAPLPPRRRACRISSDGLTRSDGRYFASLSELVLVFASLSPFKLR